MKKPPAFQFYAKDFVSDINVASMTMEERGKYITLLCHCWIEDGIPVEMPLVKQWLKEGSILSACFYRKNGKIRNKRLDEEREKQIKWSEKSSKGGTKTQQERWGNIEKEGRGKRLRRAKEKGTHTEEEWKRIQIACEDKCVKCGAERSQLYGDSLCKDHIIPICLGGSDAIENIQPICRNCNTGKTNDTTDYRPKNWKQRLTNHQPIVNSSSSSSSSSSKNNNISKDIYREIRHEVINHLNELTGKKFNPDSSDTIKCINGRLKDKNNPASKEDLIRVVDIKCLQWYRTEQEAYLRPSTLFGPKNFENYRNERYFKPKQKGYQSAETYVGKSKITDPVSDKLWDQTATWILSSARKSGQDPDDCLAEFFKKKCMVFEIQENRKEWESIQIKGPSELFSFVNIKHLKVIPKE